jgi:UDP:flavonoid glycosyltransferase YjiC (YdhE family)
MPKLLVAGTTGVLGHIVRMRAVLGAVRGCADLDLYVACDEQATDAFGSLPCTIRHVPELPLAFVNKLGATNLMAVRRQAGVPDEPGAEDGSTIDAAPTALREFRASLQAMLGADRALLADIRPEAVVCDGRWTTVLASYLAGVPCLRVTNAWWLDPEYYVPDPAVAAELNQARRMMVSLIGSLAVRELGRDRLRVFDQSLALVEDPPSYSGRANRDMAVCGPLRGDAAETTVPRPRARRVAVTLGSTGGGDDLAARLSQTLVDQGWEVRTSRRLQRGKMPGSLAELLRWSDVVVCHGGAGTVYEALAAARPVVTLPSNVDQRANSAIAEARGVGLRPGPDLVSVIDAVTQVYEDEAFAIRAGELGAQVLAERDPQAVVAAVRDAIGSGVGPPVQTAAGARPLA